MTAFTSQHDEPRPLQGTPETPESLARRSQEGSVLAFSQLVEQFEARLFNFILRRVGNWSDAEELTQETFVRAWERIANYDSRWRFSTWLFTIGLRLAVSDHRARSRLRLAPAFAIEGAHEAARDPGRNDSELGAPTWDLARRVLTPPQHTALWLRYAEGLAIAEIAAIMNRSQVSVRVTLFRAREALAREIDAFRTEPRCDFSEASAAALRALVATAGVSTTIVEGRP